MSEIDKLCKIHTSLTEEDMEIVKQMARVLQSIADLTKADVFIDCPTRNPNEAIVVAEAKPSNHVSSYKNSVVGQLALRENEPAAIRTLEVGMSTRDLKGITQENINVKQTVEPIKNKNDETIAVLIMEKDITEKINSSKRIELLAQTNEELTNILTEKNSIERNSSERNITYHIDDGIVIFDENGLVRFRNPVAEELYKRLGYKEDLMGMEFTNVSLKNCSFEDVVMNEKFNTFEVDLGHSSFQVKYVIQSNKVFKLMMLIKDITDMKQKEKELILKSVAIKEIHHRVKNNLQTIASLLRLQARRVENDEFKSILKDSVNRILSIATTHEILAQQGIDEVNIKEVIEKVKNSLIRCYNVEGLELDVSGDELIINSDKSTSIALIISELVQNSLKYAFKDRDTGKIEITLLKGKLYSTVSIVDNGVGFNVESVDQSSLGLNIVRSLVKDKLNGRLSIKSNTNGTKIVFDFKN